MIPFTFHFAFFRGVKQFMWRDIHLLCLQSCKHFTGAQNIVVHYDLSGEGEHWNQAVRIPGIEWRQADFSTTINGHSVTDQRIICDMYRLQTLEKEGGFFADLDFLFLGSFETLRHNEAIIGTQCKSKKKLACGLMGAVPGAAFIRAYIEAYKDWTPEEQTKWWKFANNIPWNLSLLHPVTVIPRPVFYPWCWSNKKFLQGIPIHTKKSIACHLWESLHPDLTVDDLKKTTVASYIETLYGETKTSVVSVKTGGLLTFN
jgi:hypothetical protein